jgi:hypothetical protein
MPKSPLSRPATRLSALYAARFIVIGAGFSGRQRAINLRGSVVGFRRRSRHVDGWCAVSGLRWARLAPASASSGTGTSRPRRCCVKNREGKNSGSDPPGCGPLNRHTPFRSDRARGRYATPGAAQQAPCCPPGMALPLSVVRTRATAGPLFGASRVRVGCTRRLGDRVIAKPFRVEGAG